MRWILNHVPTVPLGVLIIAACVGVSLCILTWVRRRGLDSPANNDALAVLFPVIGIVSGFRLAFGIVDLWTSFGSARQTISTEAGALAQLTVDIRPLAAPDRAAVEDAIRSYARAVVKGESEAMKGGRESRAAHDALDRVAFVLEQ